MWSTPGTPSRIVVVVLVGELHVAARAQALVGHAGLAAAHPDAVGGVVAEARTRRRARSPWPEPSSTTSMKMPQATLKPVSDRAQLVLADRVEDLLPGVEVEHGARSSISPRRSTACAQRWRRVDRRRAPAAVAGVGHVALDHAVAQADDALGEGGDVVLVGDDHHRSRPRG